MKKLIFVSLLLSVNICFSHSAFADDYKVYSPNIDEEGEFSLETNTNYSIDDRSKYNRYLSQVDGFEYGMTDWWQTEVSAEIEKESSDSMRATHLKWENIISPFEPGKNWVDVGFYIELEKALRQGDPNNLEGKILLEKKSGYFTNMANFIIGHNFGPHPDPGADLGFAWQTTYHINNYLNPGFEYYSDVGKLNHIEEFSDQDNVIGPVIEGKVGPVTYDAGLLEGVSSAAHETTFKLNLEFEF